MTSRLAARIRRHVEPIWDRVEHNRTKLAIFIACYLLVYAASAGLVTFAVQSAWVGMVMPGSGRAWSDAALSSWAVSAVASLAGVVHVVGALAAPERRLRARLGAVPAPQGEYVRSKKALADMAIAAGFEFPPPLWVIPDCERVNAFALGREYPRTIVGITQGLADKLDKDEQRAVFANLMARIVHEDVLWATAVSAIVGPLWALREHDMREKDVIAPAVAAEWESREDERETRRRVAGCGLRALTIPFYAPVVVVTELLSIGHYRSAIMTAEKADAEGMLLLRDPRSMLHTLDRVLSMNNTVPSAGEAYSLLFYCWAGFGFAPEHDPQRERIAKLREVLGPEGSEDDIAQLAALTEIGPPAAPRVVEGGGE